MQARVGKAILRMFLPAAVVLKPAIELSLSKCIFALRSGGPFFYKSILLVDIFTYHVLRYNKTY